MSTETAGGRLIALDGGSAAALALGVKLLRESGPKPGVSRWDASGLFYELRRGDPSLAKPSPRTLILLYASDLVFRLRWEIQPALAQGLCVIAAPYLETAIGFGRATGLPRRWLAELFQFAPKPQASYRVADGAGHGRGQEEDFLEFCAGLLSSGERAGLDAQIRAHFDALERRGRCQPLVLSPKAAAQAVGKR